MHPLMDFSGITDEELISRIIKCQSYKSFESKMGRGDTVQSIDQVLMTLMLEYENRKQHSYYTEVNKRGADKSGTLEFGEIEENPDERW